MGQRTIRVPLSTRVLAILFSGSIALIIDLSFLDAFISGRSTSGWPIGLVMTGALGGLGYRVSRIGLYIKPTEVIVRNALYDSRLPRNAVEGFTVDRMSGTTAQLRLQTAMGESIPVEVTRTLRIGNDERLQHLYSRCQSLNEILRDRDSQ